jgi:NADH-quinone oxidoreductase subunit E
MALTDQERKEVEATFEHAERKHTACVDTLMAVQKRRGWVSDEAIRDLAVVLGMTPEELDSVATFYSFIFRRPVGRHVIFICDSVSCWVMGYDGVFDRIKKRLGIGLGETTPDGRFTLLPICCLGDCDHAPALMIDEDLYGDMDPSKVGGRGDLAFTTEKKDCHASLAMTVTTRAKKMRLPSALGWLAMTPLVLF